MFRSEIIRRLLEVRGISDADLDRFLHPSLSDLEDPALLPGVEAAVEQMLGFCRAAKRIAVFGDYDCDGVCATAILVKALTALGARVEPFIPNRLTEGYGMTDASCVRLLREFPDLALVITVDNGINSVQQIADLKARGISVIVTDHHLPGDELPAADVLIDPKVAAPESFRDLCGAAVAYLLANCLVSTAKREGLYDGPSIGGELLVLAGLATVTDIMPLLGQNRILVAEALRRFRSWAPLGLRELHLRAARTTAETLSTRDFGFMIGPRINASGRLDSADQALELLMTDDREIARELARIVDTRNAERRSIEQRMTDEALTLVVPEASAQVIELPDGHPGVAGIVAARVLERLGTVPVCVIAGGHGSARAPDGVNIRDAFVACSEFLDRFGGHAAAGGFSVKPGQVNAFRERLCSYCSSLAGSVAAPKALEPDLWVELSDLTLDLAEDLKLLEPFGEGNEDPVFGLRSVQVSDLKTLGSEGRHLSFRVSPSLRGVWWYRGDILETLRTDGLRKYDLLFRVTLSDYNGRHIELTAVDMRAV